MNYPQAGAFTHYGQLCDSSQLNQKWSIHKYGGISTGLGFFNHGYYSFLSAPVGLQLHRRINNNLYAFAGITAAPSYINFNHSFKSGELYKGRPGLSGITSNNFGMYAKAEIGLMYINDERTFSISGSIGIDRSSYPLYPANRISSPNQQRAIGSWK